MTDQSQTEGPGGRRRTHSHDPGRSGSIIFGLIILAVGLWFFAERTLGIELPRIAWSSLWPLILIGVGAWILLGAVRGRS